MHAALLAGIWDDTPHGANLTFAIPVLIFVVTSAVLFVRFRASHTVPGHVELRSSRWATARGSGKAAFGDDAVHAAVGTHAEPGADAGDAPDEQAAGPGTVQSGETTPATGSTAGEAAGSERARPASDGAEDGE